jgi:hypothetical protein
VADWFYFGAIKIMNKIKQCYSCAVYVVLPTKTMHLNGTIAEKHQNCRA